MRNATKDKIRKVLLSKRGQLTKQEQRDKSARIVKNIQRSKLFTQANNIAFYHAVRGEADPSALMNNKINRHKNFYLPILSPDKNQGLVFAPINQNTQYENNSFSIPEPIVEQSDYINAETLDMIIMPLLGFDLAGNRLGMGGGYYDRCLAFKKLQISKPILIGFAYDFQQVDLLRAEPWDIGLDAIFSESQFIDFNDK